MILDIKNIEIQINSNWTITIKEIENGYIRIDSDSDLSIYPVNTGSIIIGGSLEKEKETRGFVRVK